jgi:hypothetical protein
MVYREFDIETFDSIQEKLVPYMLEKYSEVQHFWNEIDQEHLFSQVPELLQALQNLTTQSPKNTYLLVIHHSLEHMDTARLGDTLLNLGPATIHKDTCKESTRLNWPVLNGSSIETRMFETQNNLENVVSVGGSSFNELKEEHCKLIASFFLTKPTVMHVHTAHGLYRAPGPLPRYILSFNFKQDISHLLD